MASGSISASYTGAAAGTGHVIDTDGNWYIVVYSSGVSINVLKSTDQGSTWVSQASIPNSTFANGTSFGEVYAVAVRPDWIAGTQILGESSPGTTIAIQFWSNYVSIGMDAGRDHHVAFFKCGDWLANADTMAYEGATADSPVVLANPVYGPGGWNNEGDFYLPTTTTAANMGQDYSVATLRLMTRFGSTVLPAFTYQDLSGSQLGVSRIGMAGGDLRQGGNTTNDTYQFVATVASNNVYRGSLSNDGVGMSGISGPSVISWTNAPTTPSDISATMAGNDGTGSDEYDFLFYVRDNGDTGERLKGQAYSTTAAGVVGTLAYESIPSVGEVAGTGFFVIRDPVSTSTDAYLVYWNDTVDDVLRRSISETGVASSDTSVASPAVGSSSVTGGSIVEQSNGDVLLLGVTVVGSTVYWWSETIATGSEDFSGSASISHGHTVTATGFKGGEGSGSISNGHTVTATGPRSVHSYLILDGVGSDTDFQTATALASEQTPIELQAGDGIQRIWVGMLFKNDATTSGNGTARTTLEWKKNSGGTYADVYDGGTQTADVYLGSTTGPESGSTERMSPPSGYIETTHRAFDNEIGISQYLTPSGRWMEFWWLVEINTDQFVEGDELWFRETNVTFADIFGITDQAYVTFTGETASGSGAISHGHTVTATGSKSAEGSGTVSHGHTVTATGDHLEERSGSGSISHGHTVTATGNALEARSGSGAISHGHTVTATGTRAEDRSGAGAISHGQTVTATGQALEVRSGAAAISHGHTVTATGFATSDRQGSAAISHGQTVTATGTRAEDRAGSGAISHGHTVTASGQALEVRSGSGSITHGHTVTATGFKGGQGTGAVSHGHTVTALGVGPNLDKSGSGAVSHGHTVTATGVKGAESAGAVSHGHTTTATGARGAEGAGSISHGHTTAATGSRAEDRTGAAAISHGHTVSATGNAVETNSGSGSISHGHTVTASGFKGASGSAGFSHGHTITADGVNPDQPFGSGSITHSHTVTASGVKGVGATAAVTVGPVTFTTAGRKAALASASATHGHQVVATGVAAEYEGSALNAYVNGVWVTGRLKRYSGTGWAGALIRRWNGTSWEDMP